MSITKEQVEVLGDDELALVIINQFKWFPDNCKNWRRGVDTRRAA
jgi:hypothetical protein